MEYHHTSPRMTKIKRTDNTQFWLEYGAIKLYTLLKGMQNSTVTLENNLIVKKLNIHLPYHAAIPHLVIYPRKMKT